MQQFTILKAAIYAAMMAAMSQVTLQGFSVAPNPLGKPFQFNSETGMCCGMEVFDLEEQKTLVDKLCCINEGFFVPKGSYTGETLYGGRFVRCCNGVPYDKKTHKCCNGVVGKYENSANIKDYHCCDTLLYDMNKQVCCSETKTLLTVPGGEYKYQCCDGKADVESKDWVCCQGVKVPREKDFNTKPILDTECCDDGTVAYPSADNFLPSICCGGTKTEVAGDNWEDPYNQCCGSQAVDTSTYDCCNDHTLVEVFDATNLFCCPNKKKTKPTECKATNSAEVKGSCGPVLSIVQTLLQLLSLSNSPIGWLVYWLCSVLPL